MRLLLVSIDKTFNKPKLLRVNVGGGRFYQRGWKVLDYCSPWYQIPRQYIDYNFDLMSRIPFPFSNDSVSLFYSEHVLEHLPDSNCEHILSELYRCLESGGAARIIVPNIDFAYQAVKNQDRNFFYNMDEYYRQYEILEQCLVHIFAGFFVRRDHNLDVHANITSLRKNFQTMNKRDFLNYYSEQIASWLTPAIQHRYGGYHVNWFDKEKISSMLKEAGFQKVYRTDAQESRFPEMRGIQFDKRPSWSLHMEAVKD